LVKPKQRIHWAETHQREQLQNNNHVSHVVFDILVVFLREKHSTAKTNIYTWFDPFCATSNCLSRHSALVMSCHAVIYLLILARLQLGVGPSTAYSMSCVPTQPSQKYHSNRFLSHHQP
jgi:hypothetical protein